MRTKALLCAAALAAGAFAANAQVYSQNVVGYINLTLTNGYQMIANQLDKDGSMTNNTVYNVFGTTNVFPATTQVIAWDPSGPAYRTMTLGSGGTWTGSATVTNAVNRNLAPGHSVFIKIPSGTPYPLNLTLVGQVVQGTNAYSLVAGYQQMSAMAPISTGLVTGLGYNAQTSDQYLTWNPNLSGGLGAYQTKTRGSTGTWSGQPAGEPTPAIGQGFFLKPVSAGTWTQAFTVQ